VALTPERAVPALAAGEQSWGTFTVTIPGSTPGGTYYVLACADGADLIPETDEGNNHYQKGPIALSGPPLEGEDSDGDGCTDAEELGPDKALGGQRDPLNPWDFYDVPYPSHTSSGGAGTKDQDIGITTDVIALLDYAGAVNTGSDPRYNVDLDGNTVMDGIEYDRTDRNPTPWSGVPDGGIGITTDIVAILAQSGHRCAPAP
jgi:hypothetical protein